MRTNKKLDFLAMLVSFMLLPATAHAHVLITDQTRKVGAELHVDPADDPVAGKKSTLFFDLESLTPSAAKLDIAASGHTVAVPVTISGYTVSASYVFPAQDAYKLSLQVTAEGQPYIFQYSQAVTAGAATGPATKRESGWAKVALFAAGGSLLVLAGIGLGRAKQIAAYLSRQRF
jgi:hypothetical protein